MFGSSCNGFGFADSDLDLCLTFESSKDGQVILLKRVHELELVIEFLTLYTGLGFC